MLSLSLHFFDSPSGVASPLCQEGQSERTFPTLSLSRNSHPPPPPPFPSFPYFSDFSPLFPNFSPFSRFWHFFSLSRRALCPCPLLATLLDSPCLKLQSQCNLFNTFMWGHILKIVQFVLSGLLSFIKYFQHTELVQRASTLFGVIRVLSLYQSLC